MNSGKSSIKLALVGGGTGGHLAPGLALRQAFLDEGHQVSLFLAGSRPGEKAFLTGLPEAVFSQPPRRPGLLSFPLFIWNMLAEIGRARRLLKDRQVEAVVALGGYVCVPGALAAWSLGLPFWLLEQNAAPGLALKFLAPIARGIFAMFPLATKKSQVIGTPIRQDILSAMANQSSSDKVRWLVMGSSLGSAAINHFVGEQAIPANHQVTWISGPQAEDIEKPGLTVHGHVSRMGSLFAKADLVLMRAGGSSMAEVMACGLPMILVPNLHHRNQHQKHNADFAVQAGAALSLTEDELKQHSYQSLYQSIEFHGGLKKMAQQSKLLGKPQAANQIVASIVDFFRPDSNS